MKKMVFCIIPLLMVLMGCVGSAPATSSGSLFTAPSKPVESSGGINLDAAIREAAARMGENLPKGTEVALVSVASSSVQLSEYIIGRLEAALVGGKKLVVVDRANLDRVREEQGFQLSGEVDDNSAKAIGKLLGAGAIVTGAFADLGDVYSLTLKAINIETAAVAVSYPADIAKSTRIETLLASGGGAAGTQTVRRGTAGGRTPAQAAPPAAPAYKIGDTGPAGGIVFYDKGNNSGGWRYMEAAPASTEEKAAWSKRGIRVDGTNAEIGSGKKNTQLIMDQFNQSGEMGAAVLCDDLLYNGFDDWFLPSLSELSMMYRQLKRNEIGDFSSDWYWSSNDIGPGLWQSAGRINFKDGTVNNSMTHNMGTESYVRAIRQF
ncbi:MAG: hypothetical protein LBG57_11890 [Treponema sp.]|nr:hypothetical protein [Treponema sp.]